MCSKQRLWRKLNLQVWVAYFSGKNIFLFWKFLHFTKRIDSSSSKKLSERSRLFLALYELHLILPSIKKKNVEMNQKCTCEAYPNHQAWCIWCSYCHYKSRIRHKLWRKHERSIRHVNAWGPDGHQRHKCWNFAKLPSLRAYWWLLTEAYLGRFPRSLKPCRIRRTCEPSIQRN